jgi:hypothetical protein
VREAEAKPEPEVEAETEYVEDAENMANDLLRKLWRLRDALRCLPPEAWAERVGPVLWRMSKPNRTAGCEIWVEWLGEGWRERWHQGFEGKWGSIDAIYAAAQQTGWRFPLGVNLNKLDEMVQRTSAALVRGKAEIYQRGNRLVRPVKIQVQATKGRKTTVAVLQGISTIDLKTTLSKFINFQKPKGKAEWEGAPVPQDLPPAILSQFGNWRFPSINGVISAPTLREDGSVLAPRRF